MNKGIDVTIIIPTFNRSDALIETLTALANVHYPIERWEAVIVDDGSTDDTEQVAQQWILQTKAHVRYLRQENRGPAAARNRGAAAARGEILIFIDNDILVEPDFISAHVSTLTAYPGCWVLGRVTNPAKLRSTPFGRYRDDCHERFHNAHPTDQISETEGLTGQNISLPAVDFHSLGGFDESFTIASSEDWELGARARQTGIRVLYVPQITVLHNDWAVSLERFCERQRLYSLSDVLLYRNYGERSLRARLVRENSPVCFGADSPRLMIKKTVKRLLATEGGRSLIWSLCMLMERYVPDRRWNRQAYELAVAIAIFRGVREGWRRYVSPPASSRGPARLDKQKLPSA